MKYSFKKGLVKGLQWILIAVPALLVLTGVSEISLWDLMTKYVQPLLGTLTVGGLVAIIVNYVKVKIAE